MIPNETVRQFDRSHTNHELVFLTLGLIRLLDRIADAALREDAEPVEAGYPASDPHLLALLGLMSLRRRMQRWMMQIECDDRVKPSPSPRSAPEGLLR